jgi:hypothetical protein
MNIHLQPILTRLKKELTDLYGELLAAALRYRYATPKVFTNNALLIANTPYYK